MQRTLTGPVYIQYRLLILLVLLSLYTHPVHSQSNNIRKENSTVFGFISDTQAPLWIEKLWVKSNHNEEATEAIFNQIRKETNLTALFHLGDITPWGSLGLAWHSIDKQFAKLKGVPIPVYAVPGNHEYFFPSLLGLSQFQKRFPDFKKSWYSVKIKNTEVILLNSNFSHLSKSDIKEQKKWYTKTLADAEKDTLINFIIVGTHHSPFTNSTIVEPSCEVEKEFVQPFLRNSKCKLFISGHAHAFEHFKEDDKNFLVVGGGGGLQQPLFTGTDQRKKDYFPISSSIRMFHYLLIEEKENFLLAKVVMLNDDFKTFYFPYEIEIH